MQNNLKNEEKKIKTKTFMVVNFSVLLLVFIFSISFSSANLQLGLDGSLDEIGINFNPEVPINYSNIHTNSSDYWDDLDTPADINTGDLTDDDTYVEVSGDSMTGNLEIDDAGDETSIILHGGDTNLNASLIFQEVTLDRWQLLFNGLNNNFYLWNDFLDSPTWMANLNTNAMTFYGDLFPGTTLTHDLGSGALRWRNLYVQNINAEEVDTFNLHASENITVDGYINGVNISDGTIDGVNISNLSNEFVPYTGATGDVNLGSNDFIARNGNFTEDLDIMDDLFVWDDVTFYDALEVFGLVDFYDDVVFNTSITLRRNNLSVLEVETLGDTGSAQIRVLADGTNDLYIYTYSSNATGTYYGFPRAGSSYVDAQGERLIIGTFDTAPLYLATSRDPRFIITSEGDMIPYDDEYYDIGNETNRLRGIYVLGEDNDAGGIHFVEDDGTYGNLSMDDDFNLLWNGEPIMNASFNGTYISDLYYPISNPYNFYNSTDFSISDYYTQIQIDNFAYYNATNANPLINTSWNETHANTLYSNDTWVDTYFVRFTEIVGLVGNWTADKTNYYTSTIIDTLGNWSADKGNYSTTAEASALYVNLGGDNMTGPLNMSNNSIVDIYCVNFSNGDTICGNDSIDISINGKSYFDVGDDGIRMYDDDGTQIAIFNDEARNRTATFDGEMMNNDNRDGLSRFTEYNGNNGSFAVAAFTAQNDFRYNMSIYIKGTNYACDSDCPIKGNETGLMSYSPAPMSFINRFFEGFKWWTNPLDDNNISNVEELMSLDKDGNLNVSGDITASEFISGKNQVMQVHNNISTNQTATDTWKNISWNVMVAEETTSGYTLTDSNESVTINFDGIVRVQGCIHPYNNNIGVQEAKILIRTLINGVEARCLQASRTKSFKSTGVDIIEYIGTIVAEEGEKVQVQWRVDNTAIELRGDTDFDIPVSASLNLERISNPSS